MIDVRCNGCEEIQMDKYVDLDLVPPHSCGGKWERVILNHAAAAHGDDIPGGIEIRHGLCNPDGSPRRYYSKSEMAREAAKRGMTNYVVHTPSPGSDKQRNGNTQRFV
jgi:hypothetical protein